MSGSDERQQPDEDRDLGNIDDLGGVHATQEELRVSQGLREYEAAREESAAGAAQDEGEVAEALAHSRKRGRLLLIAAGVLLLALIVGGALLMRENRRISIPVAQGGERSERISSRRMNELERFKETVVSNLTELNRNVNALGERANLIQGRQDSLVKNFEQKLNESLNELTNIANASIDNIKQIEKQKETVVESDKITQQWSRRFIDPRMNLAEGIERMRKELRESGLAEEQVENHVAMALQDSGFVRVGNVAERDISQDEVAALPEYVRPLVERIRDAIYARGATDGEVLEHDSHHQIIRRIIGIETGHQDLEQNLVTAIWKVCRVRREDIDERMRAALPTLLVIQRQTIPELDPYAIESMVYAHKDKLGHDMTPGQHLALVHIIARTIDNAPEGAASNALKPLDDRYLGYLQRVVDGALTLTWNLGERSQERLEASAQRAVDDYLTSARVEMPMPQQQAFIMERLAAFTDKHAGDIPDTSGQETAKETRPDERSQGRGQETGSGGLQLALATEPQDIVQETGDQLMLSPVAVNKQQARQAAWLLTPMIMESYPGDALTKENIPAVIATWYQANVISDRAFDALAGQPQSGMKWGRTVIPQAMEAVDAGRTWITFPVPVGLDIEDPDFDLVRGVILGGTYAPLMRSGKDAGSGPVEQATQDALGRWSDFQPDAALRDRIADARSRSPYEVLATTYREMGFGTTPLRPKTLGFASSLAETMLDFGRQLINSLPQPSAWQSERSAFHANLEEGMRLLVPFSIATHSDLFMNPDGLIEAVRQDVLAFVVGEVSHDMALAQLNNSVLPMYINSVAENGVKRLAAYLEEHLPGKVHERIQTLPSIEQGQILVTARSVSETVLPQIERGLVVEVIMSRVEPRIEEKARLQGRFFRDEIVQRAREHCQQLIEEPFTPSRIDEWAIAVTGFAHDLIDDGNRDDQQPSGQLPDPQQSMRVFPEVGRGTISATVKAVGQVAGGGRLMKRTITIPAGSYGKAHLLSGIDASIGGDEGEAVLINLSYTWKGPNNSRVFMRNLRLIGEVTVDIGTERIKVNLANLSYVFPSGNQIFLPVKGFVIDNTEGLAGIRGQVRLNLDRILPYSATSGFARGFADTLTQLSTQAASFFTESCGFTDG
ncbi:MAG: TrbI/VirB10 family protein, partial [Planctomycetota bacterium]